MNYWRSNKNNNNKKKGQAEKEDVASFLASSSKG